MTIEQTRQKALANAMKPNAILKLFRKRAKRRQEQKDSGVWPLMPGQTIYRLKSGEWKFLP